MNDSNWVMGADYADEAGKQIPVEFSDKEAKSPLNAVRSLYKRLFK